MSAEQGAIQTSPRLSFYQGATEQRFVIGGSALVALVSLVVDVREIVLADHDWFVQRLPDDAYYYLEIAQRIARGEGSTFDGSHATNGFHPLWEAIVSGLALVFQGWALARATLILNVVLAFGTLFVLLPLFARVFGLTAAAFASALSITLLGAHAADGMESSVTSFALALVLAALARVEVARTPWRLLSLGAAAGTLVLSRLDFAGALLCLSPLLLYRWRSEVGRVVVYAGAGAALLVLPYIAWNLARFGHLLPVSGYLKQRFMAAWATREHGGRLSAGYVRFVLSEAVKYPRSLLRASVGGGGAAAAVRAVLGLLGLVGVTRLALQARNARWRELLARPEYFALCCLFFLVIVKACADLALSPFWAAMWYSFPQQVVATLAIALLVYVGTRLPWAFARAQSARAGLLLSVLALIAIAIWSKPRPAARQVDWQYQNALAAEWIRTQGPPGVYGSPDAGLLGFELDGTGRLLVNLDGLVNDFEWAERLEAGVPPLERYRWEGIRYLVVRRDPRDASTVPECAREIWRSPNDVHFLNVTFQLQHAIEAPAIPIRIWDLEPCG